MEEAPTSPKPRKHSGPRKRHRPGRVSRADTGDTEGGTPRGSVDAHAAGGGGGSSGVDGGGTEEEEERRLVLDKLFCGTRQTQKVLIER